MEVQLSRSKEAADQTRPDPRWELVQRVASSSAFQKSRRLRDFLLFVCDRAIHNPANVVHERELGRVVFGKSSDFDGSQDTLVRVQASQLRKRLQQYFSSEGATETVVIDIPKGTYMPIFKDRALEASEEAAVPEIEPPQTPAFAASTTSEPKSISKWSVALGIVTIVLLVLSGWLLMANHELQRRLTVGLEPQPTVDALWQQMLGNGEHTYLVLSDSNLTLFQDMIHYQLTPTEYETQQFPALADEKLHDAASRDFARRLMIREYTSITDASLARRIGLLAAAHQIPMDVILARDAGPRHFRSHNVILVGPRRANPWLALYEDRLNFRSRFDEQGPSASFQNQAPLPGEQPEYPATWNSLGYCRVAYLPNNEDPTKSVLIISGTEMGSSEAGTEFLTTERWVKELRTILGVTGKQPVPYFEVLLRTHLVISAAPSFEVVAHRVLKF